MNNEQTKELSAQIKQTISILVGVEKLAPVWCALKAGGWAIRSFEYFQEDNFKIHAERDQLFYYEDQMAMDAILYGAKK